MANGMQWPFYYRCRQDEFSTIVPRQPYRPESSPNEVRLEFEAVLLDVNKDRKNQLWIHAKIKACVAKGDCEAVRATSDHHDSGILVRYSGSCSRLCCY